jgi:hypothetical protein
VLWISNSEQVLGLELDWTKFLIGLRLELAGLRTGLCLFLKKIIGVKLKK